MTQHSTSAPHLKMIRRNQAALDQKPDVDRLCDILEMKTNDADGFASSLPFSIHDTTVGIENEFQAVVRGNNDDADLPILIKNSNYFKNIIKRSLSGETPLKTVSSITSYLDENHENIWENSWVRFPQSVLSRHAKEVFGQDVLSDKSAATGSVRNDIHRFLMVQKNQKWIRLPVSYLMKLALADAICPSHCPAMVTEIGRDLMKHFLNDNSSPETYSFYPVRLQPSCHQGIAHETLTRFLFCQFLILYANKKFQLLENGQQAMVYFAPNPPVRQKLLNDLIPDSFYRDIFISPCLSGWTRGEDKYRYMLLCHEVLSRSQLNAVVKLKEAGIIVNNLVVLPNTSNISLANNGTHISLGSLKLSRLLHDKRSGFTSREEKYFGDLVIKITEHFLPVFVGTYTAAPYRIDFQDFHPEKVFGFLPHELDFTHLRMIWRRWKKKARLNFLGRAITPFGPEWLDKIIGRLLRLQGDVITDFRLIDYLVCLMSTDQSPALDGTIGNDIRLKSDLTDFGVFDPSMALYLLYRLRRYEVMGFSGFEGRHYSQFPSLEKDMGHAVHLQSLITALAYKYILQGKIHHEDIPDDPFIESERRQIFFGAAIGIPTFYVRKHTKNRFLSRIVNMTDHVRSSRRYPGYQRIYNTEYCKALLRLLEKDAADLIEAFSMHEGMNDLKRRIECPSMFSAAGTLSRGILDLAGTSSPFRLSAVEFNIAAEKYYRENLRAAYIKEACRELHHDLSRLDSWESWRDGKYNQALLKILDGRSASGLLESAEVHVINENISVDVLRSLIQLFILTIHHNLSQPVQ